MLLAIALVLCSIAALARLSRSIGADERRWEADLAAAMARLLLRPDDLRSALPGAASRADVRGSTGHRSQVQLDPPVPHPFSE
jgi:hypothetical protein